MSRMGTRKRTPSIVPQPDFEDDDDIREFENGQRLFYGYSDEISYLDQLVKTLLRQNKANSVIICGDTGFGKNCLVEACLENYPVVNGEPDPEYDHLNVVLFKFDGNLHGKNDLATLRIIGRRLNHLLEKARQVTVEDDTETELDDSDMSSKVANSIPKIIAQFRFLIENSPNFRSIIILDNLEVFSYRQQYLLYNLFDLIQQGQSVLIIGLTRRLDCVQLLTSRVQSRLNRRMIHLVAPFKTLESYIKFCHQYAKVIGASIEKDLFKKEIEKSFSINRSFDEIKRFVQQLSFVPQKKDDIDIPNNEQSKSGTPFMNQDPKIIQLMNTNRNELVLLIIATKQLRNLDTETFTCRQLHEWSIRVTQLKSLCFEQVVKCIYNLLELDLLIVAKETRSQSSKNAQLWIAPWTTLMLNISEFQLKDLIENLGNRIPAYIKQLLY